MKRYMTGSGLLAIAALLAACGGSTIDRGYKSSVGSVQVTHDSTGIYHPDGREQMMFRFSPPAARSLEERINLAQASMDTRRDCTWAAANTNEVLAMTIVEPSGKSGYSLMAFARCR